MTVPAAPPILAIETSCDDTAAAVWADGRLASSVVAGQGVHEAFGGIVPELASRAHEQTIIPTVEAALAEAGMTLGDLGAVAVTVGPGLAGSLLVGLGVAKGIALGRGLPLVGVNHLDGHAASVYVGGAGPPTPFLCLTVSGGHTLLAVVGDGLAQTVLGRTRDDAAGEAFDKVARLLGLPYPGGPHVDRLAADGDPAFLALPSPRLAGRHGERPPFDVSFSGIKTAVRYWLDAREGAVPVADVCASFQHTVAQALVGALREAVRATGIRDVAVVGGVSANRGLRAAAQAAADADGWTLHVPAPDFSVDNAAMIAVAGAFRWAAGVPPHRGGAGDGLDLAAQPALAL